MIKVQPIIYDSNVKFMKLYCKVGGLSSEGNKIDQLTAVGDFIRDVKYDKLTTFVKHVNNVKNPFDSDNVLTINISVVYETILLNINKVESFFAIILIISSNADTKNIITI